MLPLQKYPTLLQFNPAKAAAAVADLVTDTSVFVAEVDDYEQYRSMLYALGARSVANKMLAHVNVVVHGSAKAPQKAHAKYPTATFVRADKVLARFHQEIHSFSAFVRALQAHGFTVRNPSDEGDPDLDHFELPLVDKSLHATLLHYLGTSPFIRRFARERSFPIREREPAYVDFPVPGKDLTWYYAWNEHAWGRVSAQRGDGDYPLEIKGEQLLKVAPALWTQSTGMYFHEYPCIDSITGLFIQAGIDARTGLVNGAAISRVWT